MFNVVCRRTKRAPDCRGVSRFYNFFHASAFIWSQSGFNPARQQVTQSVRWLPYSRGNMPENIESKFMLWWSEIRSDVGLFSNLSLAQKAFRAGYEAAQQSVHPTLLESPREQTRCDCVSCQQELSELPQSG